MRAAGQLGFVVGVGLLLNSLVLWGSRQVRPVFSRWSRRTSYL